MTPSFIKTSGTINWNRLHISIFMRLVIALLMGIHFTWKETATNTRIKEVVMDMEGGEADVVEFVLSKVVTLMDAEDSMVEVRRTNKSTLKWRPIQILL